MRYTKESGRERSWAKGNSIPQNFVNWNELSGSMVDLASGMGAWHWSAIALCITCLFPFYCKITGVYHFYCILLYFQLFNCSYLNTEILLWSFSPFHWGGGYERGGLSEHLHDVFKPQQQDNEKPLQVFFFLIQLCLPK